MFECIVWMYRCWLLLHRHFIDSHKQLEFIGLFKTGVATYQLDDADFRPNIAVWSTFVKSSSFLASFYFVLLHVFDDLSYINVCLNINWESSNANTRNPAGKLPMSIIFTCWPPHHNRFTAFFLGLPGWAGARRELLDFVMQGKINGGRHTDNPAGATPSRLTSAHLRLPFFTDQMPFRSPNQQCQSTESTCWPKGVKLSQWN